MTGKFLAACTLCFCLTAAYLTGSGINQKKGIRQHKPDMQIHFVKYEKLNLNFDCVPLKKVKRIAIHKDNIFILDGTRNELYVIDNKGNYLYSIGKAGQGPGEIETGTDFCISDDDRVYILSAAPKRVEIFSLKGKPLNSIRVDTGVLLMNPDSIALDNKKNIYVGSPYERLISMYSANGNYSKTLLHQQHISNSRNSPGSGAVTIGIPSCIGMMKDYVVHFDRFKGIFTLVTRSGGVKSSFSAYSKRITRVINNIEDEFHKTTRNSDVISISTFTLWNTFCIDRSNRFYALPTGRNKGDAQKMFVFSENGTFLYEKPLEYFRTMATIRSVCCNGKCFVFGTNDFNFIIAYRGKP